MLPVSFLFKGNSLIFNLKIGVLLFGDRSGIVVVSKDSHQLKDPVPIEKTFSGMIIDCNE